MCSAIRQKGWGIPGFWRQYFKDPELQSLASIVVELAAATWISMDRQQIMEWLLEARGALLADEIDRYQPTEEQKKILSEKRDAFMAQVFNEQSLLKSN